MNKLEFRNKVIPLTNREKYYKTHPSHTGDYVKNIDLLDKNYSFQLTKQDKLDLINGKHAIFYDNQKITDDVLNLPIFCTKQTRFSFIPIHIRNYIELKYVYSGHCYAMVNDKEIILHTGDILLLDINSKHTILPPSENDIIFNFQMNRSYFNEALISKFTSSNPITTFLTNIIDHTAKHEDYVIFKNREDDYEDINNLIESILCEYLDPSLFLTTIIDSYFLLLFVKITQRYQANMEEHFINKNKSYITEIIQYIQHHYQSCSLIKTARCFGYNPDYLSRMIHQSTGLSFKRLINYYRMEAISNQLINTNKPIYQIAQENGFSNLNYFYKQFSSQFGGLPADYRKQYQESKKKI